MQHFEKKNSEMQLSEMQFRNATFRIATFQKKILRNATLPKIYPIIFCLPFSFISNHCNKK